MEETRALLGAEKKLQGAPRQQVSRRLAKLITSFALLIPLVTLFALRICDGRGDNEARRLTIEERVDRILSRSPLIGTDHYLDIRE